MEAACVLRRLHCTGIIMRCLACNHILTPQQSTMKYASAPAIFIELCDSCTAAAGIEVIRNKKLDNNHDVPEEV